MKTLSKYGSVFHMGISDSFEYRFNFFVQVFSWYFPLIIQLLLWKAIYRNTGTGEVAGYSFKMIVIYYVTVMVINELVKTEGIEWAVVGDIRDGGLQKYILRPINYIVYQFFYVLSKKVIVLICIGLNFIPITLIFGYYYDLTFKIENIMLVIIALFSSMIIMYLFYVGIAMFSFWFTEFTSIFHFLPFGISLLNGSTLPLDFFPDWLSNILKFTPFYYMVFFPLKVLNNQLDRHELVLGFTVLAAWVLIEIGICRIIWRYGIKKFAAIGG